MKGPTPGPQHGSGIQTVCPPNSISFGGCVPSLPDDIWSSEALPHPVPGPHHSAPESTSPSKSKAPRSRAPQTSHAAHLPVTRHHNKSVRNPGTPVSSTSGLQRCGDYLLSYCGSWFLLFNLFPLKAQNQSLSHSAHFPRPLPKEVGDDERGCFGGRSFLSLDRLLGVGFQNSEGGKQTLSH